MNMNADLKELIIDQGEVKAIRFRLGQEKAALQAQLAELKAKCAVRLPPRDYQRIQSQRGQLVRLLMEKESEIAALNAKNQEIHLLKEVKQNQVQPSLVRAIVGIRDKWHGFSMDSSNHQKSRETAWKISQELAQVLKLYFDHGP